MLLFPVIPPAVSPQTIELLISQLSIMPKLVPATTPVTEPLPPFTLASVNIAFLTFEYVANVAKNPTLPFSLLIVSPFMVLELPSKIPE